MKQHKGMRPHDIVILLKIALLKKRNWLQKDLAFSLNISLSEVSESLNRSRQVHFLANDKKRLMTHNFLEFLEHGLKYVFPAIPGPIQRGVPTAHSAPPLADLIFSDDIYVWAFAEGKARGQTIEPLHPSVPEACLKDSELYQLLALTDVLRLGRVREKTVAMRELKKRLL